MTPAVGARRISYILCGRLALVAPAIFVAGSFCPPFRFEPLPCGIGLLAVLHTAGILARPGGAVLQPATAMLPASRGWGQERGVAAIFCLSESRRQDRRRHKCKLRFQIGRAHV